MTDVEKGSLDVVAKSALRYILEYGKEEGVIALVAQLLQLQVEVLHAIKSEAEQKRYQEGQITAQQFIPGFSTPQQMEQMIRRNQAQMAMNVAGQP
jgi:hypothetical protein